MFWNSGSFSLGKELGYLGHTFSAEGMKVDTANTKVGTTKYIHKNITG
jgi:hypothetical protein